MALLHSRPPRGCSRLDDAAPDRPRRKRHAVFRPQRLGHAQAEPDGENQHQAEHRDEDQPPAADQQEEAAERRREDRHDDEDHDRQRHDARHLAALEAVAHDGDGEDAGRGAAEALDEPGGEQHLVAVGEDRGSVPAV